MQINITCRGTEVTPSIRDYAQEKVAKLEEFFKNIQKVEVVLEARDIDDAERAQFAEIRAWMAGLKMIQATAEARDVYAAIDLALEEAKRQIQKHKEKHVKEQRRKASKAKHDIPIIERRESITEPYLVQLNLLGKKPMSSDEAKEELKVLDQDFIAFRNSETNELNIVKKKPKGIVLLKAEKAMLPEEAVKHLEKTQQDLVIFNNSKTKSSAIVFRRKMGNFGLIEA